MARCASSSEVISTKPKPRDWPEIRSRMMLTDWTAPACWNKDCKSSSRTLNGRLPTYNLVAIACLLVVRPCVSHPERSSRTIEHPTDPGTFSRELYCRMRLQVNHNNGAPARPKARSGPRLRVAGQAAPDVED